MSDDNKIEVGDVVIVVKPAPCCGFTGDLGRIFTVLDIEGGEGEESECNNCHSWADTVDAKENDDDWHPVSTLKKLPKVEEIDEEKIAEEIYK